MDALCTAAEQLAQCLRTADRKIVFAESCTGGLVAASLAGVPGISNFFCGSAVTYRNRTKASWIDVDEQDLLDPGPVSETVARQMAVGVSARTPEADLAISITGHLGPDAPDDLDGRLFVGIAQPSGTQVITHKLPPAQRLQRQQMAAQFVLEIAASEVTK